MQVTMHLDPTCPWTWLTSRWLLRAAAAEGVDVRWAPVSLAHRGAEDHDAGRDALRVVQHLLEAGDDDAVHRFYDAFGDRAHRQGRPADRALVVEATRAAGLDHTAVAAVDDAQLDAAVGAATDLAFDRAGPDVGSPVLHWTDDAGQDVWIFGPLFDRLVEPACAAEIWRGVRHLAVHPWFKELKRGRRDVPDLPAPERL
jgi:2-hydroxychromene-2-carboxylate isomerase